MIAAELACSERRLRQRAAGAALVEAVLARYRLPRLEVSEASLREGAIRAVDAAGSGWLDALPRLVAGDP